MSSQVPDFINLESANDKKNKVSTAKSKKETKNPVVEFAQEKIVKPFQNFVDNNIAREEQKNNRELQVETRGKGIGAKESIESQKQIDRIDSKEFDENNRALVRASKTEDEFVQSMKARGFYGPENEEKLRLYYQGVKPEVGDLDSGSDDDSDSSGAGTNGTGSTGGTGATGGGSSDGNDGGSENDGDPPANKPKKRPYGVFSALKDGYFGDPNSKEAKRAASYYAIDAIANYLKNMGKDIGNVGAQFTGGTIDTSRDESEWGKTMSELNAEERQMMKENMGGKASRQALQENIANKISGIEADILGNRRDYMQYCKQQAEQALKDGNEYAAISWMALSMNYPTSAGDAVKGQVTANLVKGVENAWDAATKEIEKLKNKYMK